MYDNNFNNPVLYGNEYTYELDDLSSSGVATNEPSTCREENILVDYIKRGDQNLFSKIIAGRDQKNSEGPIGENVLPAPSIGYSKIYVNNIYNGKTGTGFSVKEFFTAKDYPLQVKYTDINTCNDFMFYPLIVYNQLTNNVWASQGFSFIRNAMHGQKKREATYSGILDASLTGNGSGLVSEQAYKYFSPGDSLPVSTSYGSAINKFNCGKEVDLTIANKCVSDVNNNFRLEMDVTVGIIGIFPMPYLTAAPQISNSEINLSTCAISKVIDYPTVIKKVTTYNEGAYHTVENIAFDQNTGEPVTTKSYDEFKGTYLIQNIPGSWEYINLQQKAINQGMVLHNFTYNRSGSEEYITPIAVDCNLINELVPGDLIDLGNGNLYHIQLFDNVNNRFKILKSQLSCVPTDPAPNISQVVIINSGRQNKLKENAGSFTLHSTNKNISLPLSTVANRWTENSNPLINDLNTNLAALSGSGTFTLAGPYNNVNIEPFISDVSTVCAGNLQNASIQNIQFLFQKADQVQLKIVSFEMNCQGSWVVINGSNQ